jgi:hypothetical protein
MVVPGVVGHAEHALDRSDRAADPGADGASDHPADRPRDPVALIGALLGAPHEALAMALLGEAEQPQCDRAGREHERQPRARGQRDAPDPGLVHL